MSEEKKKQDLADVLAALAAGHHQEDPPLSGSGIQHQEQYTPPKAQPPKPAPPRPVARTGAPTPPQGKPVSGVRPPPTPGQQAATPVPANPAAPQPTVRKGVPPIRPSSPTAKPRPQTPGAAAPRSPVAPPPPPVQETPPNDPFAVQEEPTAEEIEAAHARAIEAEADAVAHVVEDSDELNLPLPDSLGYVSAPRAPRKLASQKVSFKQTLIPPLLTMGVLLPGLAAWHYSLGEESPIAGSKLIPYSLIVIGVVMLVFAVVTMLQVRAQLHREGN